MNRVLTKRSGTRKYLKSGAKLSKYLGSTHFTGPKDMPTFQNNIKIRARVFLVCIVPIIGLLYFSGQIVYQAQQAVSVIDSVNELVELAPTVSALVHELQKERGASAGFVGSNGKTFAHILARQRRRTDAKSGLLRISLRAFGSGVYGASFDRKLKNSLEALGELPGIRVGISNSKWSSLQVIRNYTGIIGKFLKIIEEMAVLSTDARVPTIAPGKEVSKLFCSNPREYAVC